MSERFEQAELVRDALNDAGYELAREITDDEAAAVYQTVASRCAALARVPAAPADAPPSERERALEKALRRLAAVSLDETIAAHAEAEALLAAPAVAPPRGADAPPAGGGLLDADDLEQLRRFAAEMRQGQWQDEGRLLEILLAGTGAPAGTPPGDDFAYERMEVERDRRVEAGLSLFTEMGRPKEDDDVRAFLRRYAAPVAPPDGTVEMCPVHTFVPLAKCECHHGRAASRPAEREDA